MKTCELLFRGDGHNLSGFIIGRQLCVVSCFFIIAHVTYLNIEPGNGNNIFGVPDTTQTFFNMGFLATGIASGDWVLAEIHKRVAGFQRDEAYIGTAEEHEAKDLGDDKEVEHALAKLP
eukprot:14542514-Ditylum_brightwellii.AAC.1